VGVDGTVEIDRDFGNEMLTYESAKQTNGEMARLYSYKDGRS
jgi:hypothetical protein